MDATSPDPAVEATRVRDDEPPARRHRLRTDLLVIGLYLLGALWLTFRLWTHIHQRVLSSFPPDQYQFEFWLEHTARSIIHGHNPLVVTEMNAPDGVNGMANTLAFGMSIPLIPVTLLFGPQVSFAMMVTLAPLLTATCWYLLFSRRIVRSTLAAVIGAGFCAFGPGMVAQDNVHPNIAMQAAIPLIFWQVLRMRESSKPWRPGLVLGLLGIYQFFINEEVLLEAAFGCLVFVLCWSWFNREQARKAFWPVVTGLTAGALLMIVALAYPIWYQFSGPQAYHGFGTFTDLFGSDLASFTAFPTHALGSGPDSVHLAGTVTEENTFFGWPLLAMVVASTVLLRKRTEIVSAVIMGGVFLVASLGTSLHLNGRITAVHGPWYFVAHVPVLDSVITSRLALATVPVVGLLIAVMLDQEIGEWLRRADSVGRFIRAVGVIGMVVALLPLFPTPFSATTRYTVPTFITSGHWRRYVPPGHTLMSVPVPSGAAGIASVTWVTAAHAEFSIPGGYFVIPDGKGGPGIFGPRSRPTIDLFLEFQKTGVKPVIGPRDRANAVADIVYWKSSVVVLNPRTYRSGVMLEMMTDLLGYQPQRVDDVWLWDVRSLTG